MALAPEPRPVCEIMCNGTERYWLVVDVRRGRSWLTGWARLLDSDEIVTTVTAAALDGTAWHFDRRDTAR